MNVEIRIDRLVVEELPLARGGERAFAAAMEAELGRLFTAGEVGPRWRGGGAEPTLRVDARVGEAAPTTGSLARTVAGAVHGGLAP